MAMPASNGKLCTKLSDMSIGDYIKCEYVAPTVNYPGTFQNLGENGSLTELVSTTCPGTTANGFFYFIKVDKGLLVADRMVQQALIPNNLNAAGFVTGKIINGIGLIRILSRTEFRKYIATNTLNGNCVAADVNVWHGVTAGANLSEDPKYPYQLELLQDRQLGLIGVNASLSMANDDGVSLTGYGYSGRYPLSYFYPTNIVGPAPNWTLPYAYRPCLEYVDNPKSTDIWY